MPLVPFEMSGILGADWPTPDSRPASSKSVATSQSIHHVALLHPAYRPPQTSKQPQLPTIHSTPPTHNIRNVIPNLPPPLPPLPPPRPPPPPPPTHHPHLRILPGLPPRPHDHRRPSRRCPGNGRYEQWAGCDPVRAGDQPWAEGEQAD